MFKRIEETLRDVYTLAQDSPVRFGVSWLVSFLILFALLASVGGVPGILLGKDTEEDTNTPQVLAAEVGEEGPQILAGDGDEGENGILQEDDRPVRIVIDAIDVDTRIENPMSRDIDVLDAALNNGAVHYPGSGTLEETSNLFLFGHSSYLPRVLNPAYQAFNGLQDLEDGDIIRVLSETKEYIYRVEMVELVDANDAWVELSNTEKKLTLSTCNNFGKKQDRYVVEANFLGSYPL